MKTLKTLEQIKRFESTQVTVQQLLNGRMYLKGKGWSDVRLTDDLKKSICDDVSELLGGRGKTKSNVFTSLMYNNIQHWGLDRIFLEKYGKSEPRFVYCAGQDMTYELNQIRTALK